MFRTEMSGEGMVFRNEYNGRIYYSISLAKKVNGKWENIPIGIDLGKDVDIPNKSKIKILRASEDEMPNASLDGYVKDKKPTHLWKIWRWELISEQDAYEGFAAIPDEECPF